MKTWTRGLGAGLAALALVVTQVGCRDQEAQEQSKKTEAIISNPVAVVTVITPERKDMTDIVAVTGKFATNRVVTIGASGPGRLTSVFVREGSAVRAGQVIAVQESEDAAARLQQAVAQANAARAQLQQALRSVTATPKVSSAALAAAEAQLAQAQAQLAKAKAGARSEERNQAEINLRRTKSDLDTAKAARDRAERLYNEGAIARADYERAENGFQNALAAYELAQQQLEIVRDAVRPEDIRVAEEAVKAAQENVRIQRAQKELDLIPQDQANAARAALQAAEESVRIARKALNDTAIRAPYAGKVQGVPASVGSMLGPGTPVAQIIGDGGLVFQAEVPELQLAQIPMGSKVVVRVDAIRGLELEGIVEAIEPQADQVGRIFRIRVAVKNPPNSVKPGMFGRGEVTATSVKDAVSLPEAVVMSEGTQRYVYVIEGDKAARVNVTLGVREAGRVQVSGLPANVDVIDRGRNKVRAGDPVKRETPGEAEGEAKPATEASQG